MIYYHVLSPLCRTAVTVWRCILEETERVARARLQAAEVYQDKIFEVYKPLKAAKVQVLKKVSQTSFKAPVVKYSETEGKV